jgi:hypothetical protein
MFICPSKQIRELIMKDYIAVKDRMSGLDDMETLHEEAVRRVEKKMNILIAVAAVVSIAALLLS